MTSYFPEYCYILGSFLIVCIFTLHSLLFHLIAEQVSTIEFIEPSSQLRPIGCICIVLLGVFARITKLAQKTITQVFNFIV